MSTKYVVSASGGQSSRVTAGAAPLIYRKNIVLAKFGISETTLRRWMSSEKFPRPRQLGPRAVGWVAAEVDSWLEERPVAASTSSHTDD
ncbi:AlpA family phage regulatory protein [Variovorax atrisoli]|uniref:helix-turn-helix transcriptional regulator n=1 Tax=Variovorax atrisoli TaxID=3394203 RepID=UPI000F7E9732|nr:AlpA family phage regulatory protein [Variovorax sp. 369]RTD94086.1 AlpA family phage regulatory protein [Variovorax sp. 369]